MLAKVFSYGISGLDAYPITIEVDVSHGLPSTVIVGLPDNAIKESKERVRSAIRNSGYQFVPDRITINLSPADIKKEGPSFDLAIAIGILAASEQIDAAVLQKFIFLGELSLDGHLQSVSGALSVALSIPADKYAGLILPSVNCPEASVSDRIKVYPVRSLKEVIHFLQNQDSIPQSERRIVCSSAQNSQDLDFNEVKGQMHVKRGLEVAAAGGHNVLLIGPPGSGKTMLANRLPSILPDMEQAEMLEATKIHSIAGLLPADFGYIAKRPFRSPHHTSSDIALVGGGSIPKPGEVTLAHHGILFLDELPEFRRNVLEALRQPLEDHHVTVSRASKTLRFPSKFLLVGAMNPCPCGWFGVPKKQCNCSSFQIQKYIAKISGPLLDRIDIHLEVPSLQGEEMLRQNTAESSEQIKKRTTQARGRQKKRFVGTSIYSNHQMNHRHIRQYCVIDDTSKELLKVAIEELGFSARTHDKILKLALTIADLAEEEHILTEHIAEAIQYRSLERKWWG